VRRLPIKKTLDYLEGPVFLASFSKATGVRTAKAICEADDEFQSLVKMLMSNQENLDIVSARFWSWASMELNGRLKDSVHPKDAACFAVLHAAEMGAPGLLARLLPEVDLARGWDYVVMFVDSALLRAGS